MDLNDKFAFFAAVPKPTIKPVLFANGNTTYVRTITIGERDTVFGQSEDGQSATAKLLLASVCNATGTRIFDEEDLDQLATLPVDFIEPVATAALELNGLKKDGTEDVEAPAKNSESDPS